MGKHNAIPDREIKDLPLERIIDAWFLKMENYI